MTIDEVIEALKGTPRTWELCQSSRFLTAQLIRNEMGSCPLAAVANLLSVPLGDNLGLSPEDTDRVMAAADDRGRPLLRERMLEACGL